MTFMDGFKNSLIATVCSESQIQVLIASELKISGSGDGTSKRDKRITIDPPKVPLFVPVS